MSDGFHAADDGSLARSTGGAAVRGAALIAVAIVIGLLLLTFALNDGDTEVAVTETEQTDDDNAEGSEDDDGDGAAVDGADASDDDADTTEAEAEPDTGAEAETISEETIDGAPQDLPASEVNVLVANGVGTAGIAGSTSDVLIADGYIGVAADAPDTVESVILYKEGFDAHALEIAAVLGAPPDVVQPVAADGALPIDQDAISDGRGETANVIVILGSDGIVPPG